MVETAEVEKILFITLSNLGDALMSLPAFDFLRRACPRSRITVIAGERTRCIFEHHPDVNELIIFDKQGPLRDKIRLFLDCDRRRFDCVVDLRNSFYGWGLKAPRKTSVWTRVPAWCQHDSQRHLYKAIVALQGHGLDEEHFQEYNTRRNPSFIAGQDRVEAQRLLTDRGLSQDDEYVVFVPGARNVLKRWRPQGFIEVGRFLLQKAGLKVVVVGDATEKDCVAEIVAGIGAGAVDLSGATSFVQLAALIQRAKIVIGNDSGVLHAASYLDKILIGIYGPSDFKRYGPWSKRGFVVRKNLLCAPCGKAHCSRDKACIETISPCDVMLPLRLILEGGEARLRENKYRRILVARTDRIGDVLISTPVLKALREHYPASYLAVMVAPATRAIVEGNPYVDKVIVFDKDRYRGFFATLFFARKLRKEGFDAALFLHPTVRVHLLGFLAGIKERIGYDRKAPYFLTRTIPHRKQEGVKHECDYNFDLLELLGIYHVQRELYMPLRADSERVVDDILKEAGIMPGEVLVAINPASSCISHRWPLDKFAEVIDRLQTQFRVRALIVADAPHRDLAGDLLVLTQTRPVDLSGRFTLSELASLFKKCRLVISNDSGPVHLAVAVKTPVISIFGRNQPGLSPRRWGPLGPWDVFLHKQTGCSPCLAHACTNHFKCLEAISADEVLGHAQRLLKKQEIAS
jgi:lipopolysaccharide heptosyltransferase II